MKTPREFVGRWRITEMELWAKDALDLVVPAHFTIDEDCLGQFQMIAVRGGLDCRFAGNRVDFSWMGDDEGDDVGGRGWAEIVGDVLTGRFYFHQGDDSSFVARREKASKARAASVHPIRRR